MDWAGEREATCAAPAGEGDSRVHRVPFDPSGPMTVAEAVVESVATVEGVDPTALPPIHDVVDPDAVDQLFAAEEADPAAGGTTVGFPYCGYYVTVRTDTIHVRPGRGEVD